MLNNKLRKVYMYIGIGLLVITLAVLLWSYEQNRRSNTQVSSHDFVMDTVVTQTLYNQDGAEGFSFLRELEAQLSMHVAESDIAQINAAAGEWVPVHADTFTLLQDCVEYAQLSDGAFDISIAPLSLLWNIEGENPTVPSQEDIDKALALVGIESMELRESDYSVRLANADMRLDLGGIAKGYALDRLKEEYAAQGITSGLVSMGSSVLLMDKPGEDAYKVAVRNPFDGEGEYVGVLSLRNSFLSTSGSYERYFEQDGVRYHHIFDPATGYPAQSGLVSVTVVGDSGALTEVLSTMILVEGFDHLAENMEQYDMIAVDEDGGVYVSASLSDQFTLSGEAFYYEVLS